jgi:hypothetical protein
MAIKKKKKPPVNMVRVNSRIRPDQYRFIKAYAKKMKVADGEAHRAIIDNFMMNV